MPQIEKAPRRRVEWPPGDPKHAREAWAKKARMLAILHGSPMTACLISAIEQYMNRSYAYAWPSNEQLRTDLRKRNLSDVKRVLLIADQLGLIERVTVPKQNSLRHVINDRRIYPALPIDCEETLRKSLEPFPNPFEREPKPRRPKRTLPKAERVGHKLGQDSLSRRETPIGANHSAHGEVSRTDQALGAEADGIRAEIDDLIEQASFIGPDIHAPDPVESLLALGRELYAKEQKGLVPAGDFWRALQALNEAALRSFVDHDQRLVFMFTKLNELGSSQPDASGGAMRRRI